MHIDADRTAPVDSLLADPTAQTIRFIDLFAGLGGFHLALSRINGLRSECVFASELDPSLQTLYKENFGLDCHGDIRQVVKESIHSIPEHDLLCAGFPCQPFSKAGKQAGMTDMNRGTLFDEIASVLKARKPKYFILENVQFIRQHDNEATWQYMEGRLRELGYDVRHEVFSPHDFGIPQHRQRIFIVGKRGKNSLRHFSWMKKRPFETYHVDQFLESDPENFRALGEAERQCLDLWQRFIDRVPTSLKLPSFPIWSMEFGATYPYEGPYPFQLTSEQLAQHKGSFGRSLSGLTPEQQQACLPSYARVKDKFPAWKKNYIRHNRQFYENNKAHIDEVVQQIAQYESQSWQKLEWNVGSGKRDLRSYILQFRASGIRVKKPDFFPSLVCTSTQTPIIGWKERYITKAEGARLQSLTGIKLPTNDTACFRALGNAVNVSIIRMIVERLMDELPLPIGEQVEESLINTQYSLFI